MAATNYTPISLYHSTTTTAVPVNTNLVDGELAINITDGKLFYKDNSGTVQVIATKATGTIGGSTTQVQYNNAGVLAGSANFTFNGTTATINTLNLTNALGAAYGGTAQTTYTAGDIIYATGATALAKLGIGLVNYILTSTGSAPQWSAPTAISVSTATNLAGGAAGSVPYQSGAGATTFLAIGTANRVLTSSGTAPQWSTALTGLTSVSSNFDTLGGSGFTLPAVLSATAPAKLYINTSTVTDGSSAIGATNALGAITSFDATTVAATNANVTYTNLATLVINAVPVAGTNVTITNPYALYVAAGASYFASTVTVNGTVNATTLDLTNLEVTNIKAKDGAASITLADSTGVATFSANPILNAGTANGVVYLNASKVATTGSALTYNGTSFGVGSSDYGNAGTINLSVGLVGTTTGGVQLWSTTSGAHSIQWGDGTTGSDPYRGAIEYAHSDDSMRFYVGAAEKMRLASAVGGVGALGIGYTSLTSVGDSGLAVLGNVGIGTSSPSQKFEVYKGAGDTLVYGSNPRLVLTVPTGANGLRVTADTTPLELLHLTDGSQVSVGGTMNMGINAANATAGSTFKSSPTIAFLSKYWNGAASVSQFQGFIGVTATAATSTGGYFGLGIGSADALRIDTSGNLGLGVTPSLWASGNKFMDVNDSAAYGAFGNTDAMMVANAYWNGSSWVRKNANNAFRFVMETVNSAPTINWGVAANGAQGSTFTFTQAMTLDASGNLGVGVTSAGAKIQAETNASSGDVAVIAASKTGLGYTTTLGYYASAGTATAGVVRSANNLPLALETSGTERARITSGGVFLVGTDNATATAGAGVKVGISAGNVAAVTVDSTGTADTYNYYSTNAAAFRFYVNSAGTVYATNTTISAISDQRLKENIQDLDVGLSKIMALKPRKFDWKEGKGKDIKGDRGWIAQEFEQVFPDLIDEWKDPAPEGEEPYKSVRADLIPVLVKAIQEQQAMINELKAEVAALKGA